MPIIWNITKNSHCELAFYTSEEERLIESNSQQKIKIK